MINLISSNYPCLKHIFMIPKEFEPLKLYRSYRTNSMYWDRQVSANSADQDQTASEEADQQYRALEAATVTLRYSTALCPSMGKTREIFDLHFLAKSGFFQANYCDVTKVEVPNCVLTCNVWNEFVAVRVYQAVKIPATTDEFAADFSFMPE